MHLRQLQLSAALLVLGVVIFLQSCAEDTIVGGSTAITGRVLNTTGDPIDDVGVVVEYASVSAGAASPFPQTADGKVVLRAPYPNPSTTGTVLIPLQVDADTTMRVDVLTEIEGGLQVIATLKNGRVTQDTLLAWDGSDDNNVFQRTPSGFVPNSMVLVRATVPATGSSPAELEMPMLLNQPASFNSAVFTFNDVTVFGDYAITDIPVGEHYTGTSNTGTIRGRERVSETVVLTFTATGYDTRDVVITLTPGEVVSMTTTLTPSPAAATLQD